VHSKNAVLITGKRRMLKKGGPRIKKNV
jgi:hypothetical protein